MTNSLLQRLIEMCCRHEFTWPHAGIHGYRTIADPDPDDPEAQIRVADIEIAAGRIEEAFDRLLGVIKRTSGDARNQARVHLIDLFEIFPPGDPAVKAARSRLATLLF